MANELRFMQYFQPHPLSRTIVFDSLRTLWEHGLRFDSQYRDSVSWEAQLQSPHFKILTPLETSPASLRDALEGGVKMGYLTLNLWDQGLEISLSFDPEKKGTRLNTDIGVIELTIDGKKAQTWNVWAGDDVSADPTTIPPYLQAWYSFIHWDAVLCDITRPLFAVGFNEGYMLDDEAFLWTGQAHISKALRSRKVPDVEQWVQYGGVRYIAPAFVTPALISDLLKRPNYQVTRLASGGIYVVPPALPYRYEHGSVYRLAAQAKRVYESQGSDDRARSLAELYYQQARMILQAIGDTQGVGSMQPADRVIPSLSDIHRALAELQNGGQR